MTRRVLVVGGTGYLGGRLAVALAADGWDVTVAARSRRAWPDGLQAPFLPIELPSVPAALDGFDSVVNLAAANELLAAADTDRAMAVTRDGAAALAKSARRANVRRFLQLSTVHVYGPLDGTITEDHTPAPVHPYGLAHRAAELAVLSAGVGAAVLRLANVIGAPASTAIDRWTLLGNDLCRQAVLQGALHLRSDGTAWRSFIAMADALAAIRHLLCAEHAEGLYHLGNAAQQVKALALRIAAIAGGLPLVLGTAGSPPTAPFTLAGGRLAESGFHPAGDLDAAIGETLAFCRAHRAALAAEAWP